MRTIIKIIFALLATNVYADWDSWSESDRRWFVASQIAITADWMTTRYGVIHRNELNPHLYESNRILGPYPSVGRVNLYHVIMLVGNYYIADALPNDQRGFYLFVRTATHGWAAQHNIQAGWQLRF
jgi:hypothetical protein